MNRVLQLFLALILSPLFQNLTLIAQANQISEAKWAAQGGYVAYLERVDATSAIFRVGRAGNKPLTLANAALSQMPRLSPDGGQVAYVRAKVGAPAEDGRYDLHIVNADGSHDRLLLGDISLPATLAWAPDGSKILVHTDQLFLH